MNGMQNLSKRALLAACMGFLASQPAMADNPFTPDSQPTGWLATPAVSFFDVSSGDEHFYRLGFYKDTWSGNVFAHDLSPIGNVDADNGPWGDPILNNAALKLELVDYSSGRLIATSAGRTFRWSSMTTDEKAALGSEAVLNYVRGDRSNEEPNGLSMRNREYVLGDILHSNIVHWSNGGQQSLFVGSNDGMLHVFDAANGNERWAYVPGAVIPKLAALATKPYVHTHYVDGTIRIANVNISGTVKSILVSGLGAGGKAIFALDVTSHSADNEAAVANKLLWEIGATGSFADLGYTYGAPQFARLENGTAVVVFANGYMSASGKAVLYVVDANSGSLIRAIDTGTGSAGAPNGLSSPTLADEDEDGLQETAYAGDLDGHLWKFNLASGQATLLFTASPVQAITAAPVVQSHPLGGFMVNFATGRMLSSGDREDHSVHYAYGIWDGAPQSNTSLLTQTLTTTNWNNAVTVRTATANTPDWTAGGNKGWKVALREGERVIGERPFANAGRYYFVTTNPTVEGGENFIYELVALTGGSPVPTIPIFDMDGDGSYSADDLAANDEIPIAKYLGAGIFSQPVLVAGDGLTTTLYVFHPDLPIEDGIPTPPIDPGVSGGHFDFDVYYYEKVTNVTETVPIAGDFVVVQNICKKTNDVAKQLDTVSGLCQTSATAGYTYLSNYIVGSVCKPNKDANKVEYYHDLTCNKTEVITYTTGDYKKKLHVHEYDDKYDVTGVNMLNASNPAFNLINAIPNADQAFKVLNQYLNPAAQVAVGGSTFQSVKTYGNLTTAASGQAVLDALPTYTRATLGNLIFNLPLDAFKNKDWWADGGTRRAGLIPTQTGCVNNVTVDGVQDTPGPNGERFNGALTVQIIKADTPADQLELNGPNASYGWRVKLAQFDRWVLAEYTTFWHHPNKACYGGAGWVADPPEDYEGNATATAPAVGSADPRGGTFGFGLAIISEEVVVSGNVTTTTWTYNDGSVHVRTETINDDGSKTIHQVLRDGTEETITITEGRGGDAGYIDPNTGSPEERELERSEGRQSWRDIIN